MHPVELRIAFRPMKKVHVNIGAAETNKRIGDFSQGRENTEFSGPDFRDNKDFISIHNRLIHE